MLVYIFMTLHSLFIYLKYVPSFFICNCLLKKFYIYFKTLLLYCYLFHFLIPASTDTPSTLAGHMLGTTFHSRHVMQRVGGRRKRLEIRLKSNKNWVVDIACMSRWTEVKVTLNSVREERKSFPSIHLRFSRWGHVKLDWWKTD